jgi:hypothetical protein
MRILQQGLLLPLTLAATVAAQNEVGAARAEVLEHLQRCVQDAAIAAAAKDQLVARLVDPDLGKRLLALCAVQAHAAVFADARQRLHSLLPQAPDDCVLRALAALPHEPALTLAEAIALVQSSRHEDVPRGLEALANHGPELLPHLQLLVRFGWQRNSTTSAAALRALRAAFAAHPAEVLAMLRQELRSERTYQYSDVAVLMLQLGVPVAEFGDALVYLLEARGDAAVTRLLAADPTVPGRLADLCAHAEGPIAQAALRQLGQFGPQLAELWPKLAPCLRSGLLAADVGRIARQIRRQRPEAIPAVLAAVPTATPAVLAGLAQELARCQELAPTIVPVLLTRLPAPDAYSCQHLLDAIFQLRGHDELRALLPQLLAHAEPDARARACSFAAALAGDDATIRARLQALAHDEHATVREAATWAEQLLASKVDDRATLDRLRDRDPHRALAAWWFVHTHGERWTATGIAGAGQVTQQIRFAPFVLSELLADFVAGHVDRARCEQLLAQNPLARDPDCAAAWLLRSDTAAVHAAATNPLRNLPPQVQQRLSREQILAKVQAQQAEATRAALRQLGDPSAAVRSAACATLRSRDPTEWRADAQRLRRQGSAAERRCAAALLEPMTPATARQALQAPEPFLVALALNTLLDAEATDPAAGALLQQTLRDGPDRRAVLEELYRAGLAADLLRHVATHAADPLPVVQLAYELPGLRETALGVLPLLGEAARPFLPDVLRGLRTNAAASAACTLMTMGFTPRDPEWPGLRDAVEGAWRSASFLDRQALLPAIFVLGDDAAFATADLPRHLSQQLRNRAASGLSPAWQGWIELALRSDVPTQRHVVMLLCASASLDALRPLQRSEHRAVVDLMWVAAERSTALREALRRTIESSSPQQRREWCARLLDGAASEGPLPGTQSLLAAQPDLVLELMAAPDRANTRSMDLARTLARAVPKVFLQLLARSPHDPLLRRAIADLQPADAVAAETVRLLQSSDSAARPVLAQVLVAQGEHALRWLPDLLDGDAALADHVLAALGAAGSRAHHALPLLRTRMTREDPRWFDTISRIGPAGLTLVVEALGGTDALPIVEAVAMHGDAKTRCAALRRLCELAPERGRAAAHGNLGAPDAEVRRWASLLALGPDSPVDAAVLLPLLRDEEPLLRRRALAAMASVATWTPELGCAATDLLADPQAEVRALAVRAFAAHGEEIAASRIALQEALANAGEGALADELRRLLAR